MVGFVVAFVMHVAVKLVLCCVRQEKSCWGHLGPGGTIKVLSGRFVKDSCCLGLTLVLAKVEVRQRRELMSHTRA